ncbi:hypothetical protein DRQ53_05230 [bacterium]|nr:MAG: hypothetical protein DRQ53_05230 [bacterium]
MTILLLVGKSGAETRPTIHIAYLHDGPAAPWAEALRDSLAGEVERVLTADYEVARSPDLSVVAVATRESCREALLGLLGRRDVDIIIATGPLGSMEAASLSSYPKPVIGSMILDPGLQGVPLVDGTSGIFNFTYVTSPNPVQADLAALGSLIEYDTLVFLGSSQYLSSLSSRKQVLEENTGSTIVFVPADGPVSAVIEAIPATTDAVYLLPLITSDQGHIDELLVELRSRQVPVISMRGERDVRAGALLGVAPSDWQRRVFRRVALAASSIAMGDTAADLPVLLSRSGKPVVNMGTARAIGVSPSFSFLIDAVQIDESDDTAAADLDLFTAMDEAQLNNQDIAATERVVLAGSEEVGISSSVLLPQLNGGLSGTLIDEDVAAYLGTLSESTFGGHVGLTQIIWSDQAWANYSIAKDIQTAREHELSRVRLNVGLQAATAYLDVLRANTLLDVLRQNLTFSRANLDRAQVRVDAGDANRSELYRWESKIAGEKTTVIEAMSRLKSSGFELNRVLSRPLEDVIDIADATLDDQFTLLADPRVERFTDNPAGLRILRDFLTDKGLASAPELLQFDASIKAQNRAHTAATRSFWSPTVGLSGSLDHAFSRGGVGSDMSAPGLPNDTSWNLSVFLTLPIFEGGSRFAESGRTSQEILRLERDRYATAERIEREVRSAVFQAASSNMAIDLSRRSAEAARLNLEIVADNYSLGRALLVDLIDAQSNALNADLAAADAVYAFLLDLMRVERAVGQFTFFVEADERTIWVDELEAFAVDR